MKLHQMPNWRFYWILRLVFREPESTASSCVHLCSGRSYIRGSEAGENRETGLKSRSMRQQISCLCVISKLHFLLIYVK